MVLWRILTLDHLDTSGFGRPFPRHGLQLLFWFSNHCVTFEPDGSAEVMKLVSGCQPEDGAFGFHRFGNMEELLPVLHKPKRSKSPRQLVYFVVGNLSIRSHPRSADLPPFVRENLGADGVSNSDRVIISYQGQTRLVRKVYVTEHDAAGRFRSDGTHEVSAHLVRLLQDPQLDPQLDLSSLLTQMGYYDDAETLQDDPTGFFSQAFSRQLDLDRFWFGSNTDGSGSLACYTPQQQQQQQKKKKKKKKRSKKPKPQRERSSSWSDPNRDYDEDYWIRSSYGSGYGSSYGSGYGSGSGSGYRSGGSSGKGGGGFFWFLKLVLKAGTLYLAARCLFWLVRNLWSSKLDDEDAEVLQRIPGWTSPYPSYPRYPRTHIMLDYVY